MQEAVNERFKISPYLVFYLIVSMQIGVGVLGFQRIVAATAGNDAWISVLLSGVAVHIIIWMIYRIAKEVNGDIVDVHSFIFGNIIGKAISTFFIVYFFIFAITVLATYIEIIQVWMFPDLNIYWFTFAFMVLCIYIIFGGFRTVVGIAFFGLVLPAYLFVSFGFTLKYVDYFHILPVLSHSFKDIALGSYHMSLTLIGFETLLFAYPYIKEPEKSQKWAQLAIAFTTIIYTILMILGVIYYSEEQATKTIWPTLTMWKIVSMPFVERFEYIGIASWSLVILPNICVSFWVVSRLIRRIFNIKQKVSIFFICTLTLLLIGLLNTRERIDIISNLTSKMGAVIGFVYIPLLLIGVLIVKKVKKYVQQKT